MQNCRIMAIRVDHRSSRVPNVQELLTEYGCYIQTRVGFHETTDDYCSEDGIIILNLRGEQAKSEELHCRLNALDGVEAKFVEFAKEAVPV